MPGETIVRPDALKLTKVPRGRRPLRQHHHRSIAPVAGFPTGYGGYTSPGPSPHQTAL